MKTAEEIQVKLAEAREWLDENEGMGRAEEGVETGWEQALAWVLGMAA